ncbi:MAG: hypothetical protein MJ132_08680 [Clostridia bacterium]|nr:hypothetical protein [Clostridia bacterium]
MKEIILSADSDGVLFLVPDVVAENLAEYCLKFCDWVYTNPKFETKDGVCYNHYDFIDCLNEILFPNEISKEIKNVGPIFKEPRAQYQGIPYYNF